MTISITLISRLNHPAELLASGSAHPVKEVPPHAIVSQYLK